MHCAPPNLVLISALLCVVATGRLAGAQTGTFSRTGSMTLARTSHAATLLTDGRVLITGGMQTAGALAAAEIYDPGTGRFVRTGDMIVPRRSHASTMLPDGRVLITGGYGVNATGLKSAEVYDPVSGTFTATGDMLAARGGHSALLLVTGKGLVIGGYDTNAYPNIAPAELYDPASGTFSEAATYIGRGGCDFCAPSVLLTDNRVLFTGQRPAQVYEPVVNRFRAAGTWAGEHDAAALLDDGRVLFAGGQDLGRSSSAELYDPVTHSFTRVGDMGWRRSWHSLTRLGNGMVLAAGGETEICSGNSCWFGGSTTSAELYDPPSRSFMATGDLAVAREVHTATLLNDGRVLLAGGVSYGGIEVFGGALASAELYTPTALAAPLALMSRSPDAPDRGAIFHRGTFHPVTSEDPAAVGEEIDVASSGWSGTTAVRPRIFIGGRLADVISVRRSPAEPRVTVIRLRVPDGIATGDTVSVRMFFQGRFSNQVTISVR